MATQLSVQNICRLVAEQGNGFTFGKPDRTTETSLACILPILRETSQKRQYITYAETEQVIATDSGSINKVNLENTSKEDVFLRSGTIFAGKGTQSRALTRSTVLHPGQKVVLDVRCVHQTHGINPGSEFKYGGITPLSVDSQIYCGGYTPKNQTDTWNAVRNASLMMNRLYSTETPEETSITSTRDLANAVSRGACVGEFQRGRRVESAWTDRAELFGSLLGADLGVNTPAAHKMGQDNLKKNFDAFAKNFDDVLSKARLHDNQVGMALITDKGCQTIELFDVGESWEAIHKDAVKRMGTELLRGPDNTVVFQYNPENAINAVKAVLGLDYKYNKIYEHKPSNGESHLAIFGMTAQRYVGEVVELDGRVIHLVILETAAA